VKVVDLFSGIGGFSLGLESTGGFETVQFVENHEWCQKVLAKNFPGVPIAGDIKQYEGKKADVVTGGFPCQPFSVAGKRKGTNDDRHLWPEMLRVIKACKPRWVIGENVRNLTSIQDGMVFEQVCTDLEEQGYEVQSFVIPASAVNAPHQRYRVWIVAHTGCSLWKRSKFREENESEDKRRDANQFERSSSTSKSNVADSKISERDALQTNREYGEISPQEVFRDRSCIQRQTSWWSVEPNVGRVAHGIPDRVDRLKGLGNAIVPQIAYQLGLAILKAEHEQT